MGQCSNCGAELKPAANFCSNCGATQAEVVRAEMFDPAAAAQVAAPAPSAGAVRLAADRAAQPRKIENHLIKSIIATVCCCIPFGVVGIVYATRVDTFLNQGNRAAAEDASMKAGLWSNLAIGIGLVVNLLVTILSVVYQMKVLNLPSL
ncbi:MAG: CD225/dispanin family protein [Chitinispirillales bacterium]|jgi:hypothetical protein|nr:CD225/dispanin family protein [Chitinispirillales bacterium]